MGSYRKPPLLPHPAERRRIQPGSPDRAFSLRTAISCDLRLFPMTNPDWSRQLITPIHLSDGTVLRTLGDAADRVVRLRPTPSAQVAAERIIEAATKGGNMFSTHAAIRLALLKGAGPDHG